MTTINITTPDGLRGIAVEPWGAGEIYAVAANWAQASGQVYHWGGEACDGWVPTQWQVADFCHDDRAALRSMIVEAIEMGGDEVDDDEVDGIIDDAVDLRTESLGAMVDVLESHGSRYTGNDVDDEAQGWIDQGFSATEADEWCDIGMWDAATAAACRDADKTPDQIAAAAKALIEDVADDDESPYTDGDPIYSACNGDTSVDVLIDAVA